MTQQGPSGGAMRDGTELVFVALGGIGEIGMNVYLYGLGPERARRWLMVDLGVTFPHEAEPGVDVVLPDLRFIEDDRAALDGILITHAHEDHIGAVLDLWPRLRVPVYATPFTAAMLRSRFAELGNREKPIVREVALGSRFAIGAFDVELVTMAHSIPEPSAAVIRTPVGTVFHSGDWKFDSNPLVGAPSDEAKLKALGAEGVHAVVCDSTNAFREGHSVSEADVAESLARIISNAKRRVAITTFASNVARIRAIADAARATRRHLVVVGRAMHRVIQVAIDTGYLPEDFRFLDQQQFGYLEPEEVLALCTGSQGEPQAALARIAQNEHPDVQLGHGDLVIFSARTIPGNERAVNRVQNGLALLGCEIITDADALVHVTGHPRRDELRELYAWLKPQVVVPMHGEARHLREHARLARAAGVPDVHAIKDGMMIRLAPGPAAIVDDVPVGRIYRDGRVLVPGVDGPVRERRRLSFVGIAVVSLVINRRGELVTEPEAALEGLPAETADGTAMLDIVLDAVDGTVRSIPLPRRRDRTMLADAVRRAVRAAVDQVWGKKPVVRVLVSSVDG